MLDGIFTDHAQVQLNKIPVDQKKKELSYK